MVDEGTCVVAQKAVRELVDDLDGSPAVATVRFGYAGRDYEIELNEAHAAELEEFLAPYREHARQVGGGGRAGRGPRPPRQDTDALRRWAREQGYQVSDRGRPPKEVVAAYQAAHGGGALRPIPPLRYEDGCWSASSLASRANVCTACR